MESPVPALRPGSPVDASTRVPAGARESVPSGVARCTSSGVDRRTPSAAHPVTRAHPLLAALLATASLAGSLPAQAPEGDAPPLFTSLEPVEVTLRADFTALLEDRTESPDRPGVLVVAGPDGSPREIPVEIRTRGSFRLDPANCSFPPLRIDVDGDAADGTVFAGQDDLKMVSSCRPERASWEELVVEEYLAYRAVGQVTPESFRVRLLDVAFDDTGGTESGGPRLAFVIEEDDAMAARLGAVVFDLEEGKNIPASAFDPVSRMTDAVAQYMIGNPDWSDVAGHNVEILERDGAALAIPYDFDFSGLVDAPYAVPPPEYRLESVRERYYRGWCENPVTTRIVLQRFRQAEAAVLELWRAEPRLSDRSRREGLAYLTRFFEGIESEERAEQRFLRDCRPLPG